jgi:hypothetical protein
MTLRFAWLLSVNLALISLVVGCGDSSPVNAPLVCGPDGAAGSDAGAAGADGGAAGSDAGAQPDVLWLDYDALTDGPAPPGVVFDSLDRVSNVSVTVDRGLREDLSAAMGILVRGSVTFAGTVGVVGGYGVDYVDLKVGSVMTPWGVDRAPGLPFIVSFGGARVFGDDPGHSPHPEYAPARALYDAMTQVPTTTEHWFTGDSFPTRTSPGGRVKCHLTLGGDGAACYFTGVQGLHIF